MHASDGKRENSDVIRVAVVYRVCQHWRAPMFARLAARPELHVRVLHGQSVPGTKLINGTNLRGFEREELTTLSLRLRSSGRDATVVFAPSVMSALHRFRPDVILTEGGSNILTNVLVFAYATATRVPVVWWTLGMLPNRTFSGLGRIYRKVVTMMERRASTLLGYSSRATAYFENMGYPAELCFRAVNCVDTERVLAGLADDREHAKRIATDLSLEDRFVVLFVGALTRPKRIHRLLRAFATVQRNHPKAYLLMVGDGPDRDRLQSLAASMNIIDDVHFAGEVVEGVGGYYEAADAFVLPGLGGLAVSEAMTHGVPVICGLGDGSEVDLVIDGRTGFRFETDHDTEAEILIAASLEKLLSDPELAPRLGRAAKEVIDTKYNVQSYIASIADAIRHAYNSNPNGRRVLT